MTTEKYTVEELSQALKDTGNPGLAGTFLAKIAEQADKNRKIANPGEFTEAQVRRAIAESVHRPGSQEVRTRGLYWSTENFISDVIRKLRNPDDKPEFVAEAVYRATPSGKLWKCKRDYWVLFGDSNRWYLDSVPPGDLERVL